MPDLLPIVRKEFRSFFASPAAYLFLGAFLAAVLFLFFWVEAFFARNIADVRPLFEYMPVALIFLIAALTMRSWAEERRSGTLESLMTAPVSPLTLIAGKFLATLALIVIALALTFPLPLTVAQLGNLDWGPVIGGYVATLFLSSAYIAVGLYMSSRTDNAIVALILTALACGVLYLIGSDTLTRLFGYQGEQILGALGAGSRFESITRGVLDFRDLYYYLTLTAIFLVLNLAHLERQKWSQGSRYSHRRFATVVGLVLANVLVANFWLMDVSALRVDLTGNQRYTLSDTTREQMDRLQEPLTIRGYFSSRTHPLLSPLVPELQNLLREYAIAGGDRVDVRFLDPQSDPEIEEEAASEYGIQPVPFQTASRYESSVVNAYFDLVVSYGDEYETLNFQDLIAVRSGGGGGQTQVELENPEYSVTQAIRSVVSSYQTGGSPFEVLDQPVTFTGYFSPEGQLPQELADLRQTVSGVVDDMQQEAGEQFSAEYIDPEAGDGQVATRLEEEFGFTPQATGLLNPDPFWFYMMLESGDNQVQVPLPQSPDEESIRQSIEDGLQRLAPGFMQTVAISEPSSGGQGPAAMRGMRQQQNQTSYSNLRNTLQENVRVVDAELDDGQVPEEADLLLVLAPSTMSEEQVFAIDQFLMRGGSVVLASSPFNVSLQQTFSASRQPSGLSEWLENNGITIEPTMVLDPQNASLPVPVRRQVGGVPMQQIQMMPYPHFPDVRQDGLNSEHPITAPLEQLNFNWVSPLSVDTGEDSEREVFELAHSSPESWRSDELNIIPDYDNYPDNGFEAPDERQSSLLAVAVEGRFDSFFQDRESPLLDEEQEETSGTQDSAGGNPPVPAAAQAPGQGQNPASPQGSAGEEQEDATPTISGVIERSPASARLTVVGSNSFANDTSLALSSQALETQYTRPVEFMQNAIDWSLEDPEMLALRGESRLARTLVPISETRQQVLEYANYGFAAAGLLVLWLIQRSLTARKHRRYQAMLAEV